MINGKQNRDTPVVLEDQMSRTSQDSTFSRIKEGNPRKSLPIVIVQLIACLLVIVTCLANLSFTTQMKEMWIALLASCIGYVMPSPEYKPGQKTTFYAVNKK